jgi:hypothetical protein
MLPPTAPAALGIVGLAPLLLDTLAGALVVVLVVDVDADVDDGSGVSCMLIITEPGRRCEAQRQSVLCRKHRTLT